MADAAPKPVIPAYTTYGPLISFLNKFREEAAIPLQVDRSHLRSASGSTAASHLQSLRFLQLIDDKGRTTPLFEKFVMASDEERKVILKQMLQNAYPFLFGDFDLARASGKMVEDKFREQQVGGSTVGKCMAFFLAAAKDADIKVATAVKPPARVRNRPKKENNWQMPPAGTNATPTPPPPPEDKVEKEDDIHKKDGVLIIDLAIPINRKARLIVPAPWTEKDWGRLKQMLDIYIEGWKEQQGQGTPGTG